MKMKQLKELLSENNCSVSERMIKYYIETGLLPLPEYTSVNQARYSRIHAVRLMKIAAFKKNGMSFSQIKEKLASDDERIYSYAAQKGISRDEAVFSDETASREYIEYLFSLGGSDEIYTRQALLKKTQCDELVFRLAADTGALEDKDEYTYEDMLVLTCISELFKSDDSSGKADVIEKISDISKLNNISAQLVNILMRDKQKTWIYKVLSESLIGEKLKANENKTTADA